MKKIISIIALAFNTIMFAQSECGGLRLEGEV